MIDEGIDLEIVLEAAEIEVRRADTRQLIVDQKQFGVQETGLIKINLYTGPKHIV